MGKIVVAAARTLGSGGEEVCAEVARRLRIPLLDREIITRAAATAGVSEDTVEEAERVPSFLARMVELLGRYPVAAELVGPAGELPPVPALTTSESYRSLIEDVVRQIAEGGSVLILGHSAQAVLLDTRGVLKVLVCARTHTRVARLMGSANMTRDVAEKLLRDNDRERRDFYQSYYKMDWMDPRRYDLTVNTDAVPYDLAAELIVAAARRFEV